MSAPARPRPTRPPAPRERPRELRFVAPANVPLSEALRQLGVEKEAVAEGRVFVDARRAGVVGAPVSAGQVVSVSARSSEPVAVAIVYRDRDLLIVDKPAGTPTIPDSSGARHALTALAARAAGLAESALHPTSRLDREVSGLVAFALTRGGRERLEAARAQGTYLRRYVALAQGAPPPAGLTGGRVDAPIGRAADPRHRRVDPEGKPSSSRYRVIAEAGGVSLVAFAPETGRTHQLRVHAASLGAPLLGDRTYGGPARLALPTGKVLGLSRIYLHCAGLKLPAVGGPRALSCPVPAELQAAWAALGGDPAAWAQATSWDTQIGSGPP